MAVDVTPLVNDLRRAGMTDEASLAQARDIMSQVSFFVDSKDTAVSIEMAASGRLVDVQIQPEALSRHSEESLGRLVSETIRQASRIAIAAMKQVTPRTGEHR